MKLYADLPARRTLQLLSDVLVVCWTALWVWVGRLVHDTTMALAAPGHRLEEAGAGFRERMSSAAGSVDDLPLLDDRLAAPFRSAAGTGTDLETTGRQIVDGVTTLATVLGWVTAVVPVVLVLATWLWLRARFVRRATAAQRFIDSAADLDLFALRAMAKQPMARLARISEDPVGAWRTGDRAVVDALADLELRTVGLHAPRRP